MTANAPGALGSYDQLGREAVVALQASMRRFECRTAQGFTAICQLRDARNFARKARLS